MPKATIPIYHDDDFERLAELRMEVSIAERRLNTAQAEVEQAEDATLRAGDDVPGDGPVQDAKDALHAAQEAFNAFVDEASERAEMWELKAIGHEEFRALLKEHPPRMVVQGEGEDRKEITHPEDGPPFNVNTETFPKALLLFVDQDDEDIRTVVAPKFDTEAALRKRVKRLSVGEFETLWTTVFMENKGGVADPKLVRF